MLNKISGLARTLYIVLAIVAGFVALGGMNVALALVVLGLIAGLSMPEERHVLAAVTVIALPIIGAALGQYPGDRRTAQRDYGQPSARRRRRSGQRARYPLLSAGDGRRDGLTGGEGSGTAAAAAR